MTTEKARLALELARTNHERIAQAASAKPNDPEMRRALTRAVAAGRAAWRWYLASGAAPEEQIRGAVPEAFKS